MAAEESLDTGPHFNNPRIVPGDVGLVIGIFQALTQIQEMTLAFVPKIICVFLALVLLFPFMFSQIQGLSDSLFAKIAGS